MTMNAKQAKRLRREARRLTPHLADTTYAIDRTTIRTGECRRGAYKALKTGRYLTGD